MQFRGGSFIVLSVGAHCGKPQSQSACSPQLEEEEDHGKMYQQLYAVNLSSMQRHGKALQSYSLYVAFDSTSLAFSWRLTKTLGPPPQSDALTCRGYEGAD